MSSSDTATRSTGSGAKERTRSTAGSAASTSELSAAFAAEPLLLVGEDLSPSEQAEVPVDGRAVGAAVAQQHVDDSRCRLAGDDRGEQLVEFVEAAHHGEVVVGERALAQRALREAVGARELPGGLGALAAGGAGAMDHEGGLGDELRAARRSRSQRLRRPRAADSNTSSLRAQHGDT